MCSTLWNLKGNQCGYICHSSEVCSSSNQKEIMSSLTLQSVHINKMLPQKQRLGGGIKLSRLLTERRSRSKIPPCCATVSNLENLFWNLESTLNINLSWNLNIVNKINFPKVLTHWKFEREMIKNTE